MSFLHDVLSFEKFNLGDMLKKIKEDPIRAPLGALDPFSTGVWNQVLGKKWEPLVDQFGGAYGGNAVTLGDTGQGVYGRAEEAGIPTQAGAQVHDLAHALVGLFAGGYGASKIPAAGGQTGLGKFLGKINPNQLAQFTQGLGQNQAQPLMPFVPSNQEQPLSAVAQQNDAIQRAQILAKLLRNGQGVASALGGYDGIQ